MRLSRRYGRGAVVRLACGLVAVLLLTGCQLSGLQFFQDQRVAIIEPKDRSTVTLPVTLRWDVTDFETTGANGQSSPDAGYFAVFVDRSPIPPGKSLEWFARQKNSCGTSACGKVENIAHVHPTDQTSLQLEQLPALREKGGVEKHEAVIVLLDGTGQRIGESAFYVRFNFKRRA